MGREVKRVPLDFGFPIDESWPDHWYTQHRVEKGADHECDDSCPYCMDAVPTGEGWQLWQTVSDGPISPVFDTAEKLIDWMSQPVPMNKRPHYEPAAYPRNPWAQGWRRETAEKFVRGAGWMPSGMIVGGQFLSADAMVKELK